MNAHDAKTIVDANAFMTLATADAAGTPWASPVWFATVDYRDFYWVSKPGARHSRNIAARPEVAIVIFDSQVQPYQASAVYMPAVAAELEGAEAESGLEIFSGRSVASGLPAWTVEQIGPAARHRLYRATAREHFVLNERDERIRVEPVP
jgi:pyridoxine/pyridoxamine 5'-phosphate oxidase